MENKIIYVKNLIGKDSLVFILTEEQRSKLAELGKGNDMVMVTTSSRLPLHWATSNFNKALGLVWRIGESAIGSISELAKLLNYDFTKFTSKDGVLMPFESISSEIETFNKSQLLT